MSDHPEMRERYLDAALAIVSSDEPLTLHRLARRVGRSHTALYWHFRDLDELLAALVDREFAGAITGSVEGRDTPREALIALAFAVRSAFLENPRLAASFSRLPRPGRELASVSVLMLEQLRLLGLEGDALTTAYQALESLIIGANVYDHERAPSHLATRRERFVELADPAFADVALDDASVEAHNERSFRFALEALLDACEAAAPGGRG